MIARIIETTMMLAVAGGVALVGFSAGYAVRGDSDRAAIEKIEEATQAVCKRGLDEYKALLDLWEKKLAETRDKARWPE